MKILLVQEHQIHRECYVGHLTRKGHQVDCFLPGESFFAAEGIPLFREPAELANLVRGYDATLLDRETFRDTPLIWDSCFLDKYVRAIFDSGYPGRVVVETSGSEYDLQKKLERSLDHAAFSIYGLGEVVLEIPEFEDSSQKNGFNCTTILAQPFRFKVLDEALGIKKLSKW